MAFFDWNGDGKMDSFDTLLELAIATEMMHDSDNEAEEIDLLDDDDFDFDD